MEIEKILSHISGFDWDSGNINKIWKKHLVAPNEAEEVFFNKPLLLLPDEKHSNTEERFSAMGKTDGERLLFVTWTVRERLIRVISARPMSRKERRKYANET
ncbi:MAG TPA: BrnT family toxin [Candidatus Kapabacteria bacterium]|nr:BrnT family toxin [Candidatus Kapabacteria bacterium]